MINVKQIKREKRTAEMSPGKKKRISITRLIVEKGRWIQAVFAIVAVLPLIAVSFINVNCDLSEYLSD